MRKPKELCLVVLVCMAVAVTAAPLKEKRESELPHSKDYYDGYVKALVDHYPQILRNDREIRAAADEDSAAVSAKSAAEDKLQDTAEKTQDMAEKAQDKAEKAQDTAEKAQDTAEKTQDTAGKAQDDAQKSADESEVKSEAPSQSQGSAAAGQNDQSVSSDTTAKQTAEQKDAQSSSEAEKSESTSPNSDAQTEKSTLTNQISNFITKRENFLLQATKTENLPETMQDIKYYTGKSQELEDMKKRSSEDDVADPEEQSATKSPRPARRHHKTSVKKTPDMESESKVIAHSSSNYTPGDPFKNPPQNNKDQDPDPNKEEPYKKETDESTAKPLQTNSAVPGKVNLPFMPVLLLPVKVDGDGKWDLSSVITGERKDKVPTKRQEKKEDDKKEGDDKGKDEDKDKDKDEDKDKDKEIAFVAPLPGYPGWFGAGHGIYDYGPCMQGGGCGHQGYGDYGVVHHGGFGHHGYGHRYGHGYGHGYGHHGYDSHIVLDNGIMWPPNGGYMGGSMLTPCGCHDRALIPFGYGNGLPFSLV